MLIFSRVITTRNGIYGVIWYGIYFFKNSRERPYKILAKFLKTSIKGFIFCKVAGKLKKITTSLIQGFSELFRNIHSKEKIYSTDRHRRSSNPLLYI